MRKAISTKVAMCLELYFEVCALNSETGCTVYRMSLLFSGSGSHLTEVVPVVVAGLGANLFRHYSVVPGAA